MAYQAYIRKANYYETDKMGIVHHSNYIRYLEECRMDFMDQIGISCESIESKGILMPVLKVECDYHVPTRYGEKIKIVPMVAKYTGVKVTVSYEITNPETGELHNRATTEHCFIDENFRPVIVRKALPEVDEILKKYAGMNPCEV